jgi:signal transduction histidine kinase
MVGTQIDVSERIGLQVQARDHVQRLRRIARQLPGVLFQYRQVPGRRGQFEYVSERAQQLLGVEPATLMRDALALLGRVDGDDLAELRAQAQRCAEDGQPLRGEVRLRRSDARLVVLRCTAQGQALQGGGAMWHGHLDDVSGERDSEQQQLRARAQQSSDRARSGFLARMSHELRTPLNAVLGFAQLLRSDVVDPPTASQAARLARIQDAGEHLLGMIGDLLDLTHLETGRLTVLHEPVQLDGVVRQCVELMRPLAERAGLSLQFDAGESLLVCGDRLRLQQIVVNLLSNAIKYNRPLGWVRMTCGTVEAGLARLDVVDSGLGLAPEQLAHLFEPFNRLGRDHSGIDGTGIGLALSRNLADMMQARIEVRSEPGRGSTFSLVMPLHQAVDLPS